MNSPRSPVAHIPLTNTRRGNNMARLLRNNAQTNMQKFRAIRLSHLLAKRRRTGHLNNSINKGAPGAPSKRRPAPPPSSRTAPRTLTRRQLNLSNDAFRKAFNN